jgi:hypothetical protein
VKPACGWAGNGTGWYGQYGTTMAERTEEDGGDRYQQSPRPRSAVCSAKTPTCRSILMRRGVLVGLSVVLSRESGSDLHFKH